MHAVEQLAHAAIGIERLRCAAHLVVATHQALMESLRQFVGRDTATVKIERLLVSSVLLELARPENERSPTTLQHEADRGARMADLWEEAIAHPVMSGPLNLAQITLACALGLEARNPYLHWRPGHPKLCDWLAQIAARPSLAATAPPANA